MCVRGPIDLVQGLQARAAFIRAGQMTWKERRGQRHGGGGYSTGAFLVQSRTSASSCKHSHSPLTLSAAASRSLAVRCTSP